MMREVTVAALMCFTLGGSGGAAQNLDGEGLSEGEAEAVWLQPRKLMKVVEGTSHEVQWFTMLPDVASVTAQVEDQTVARVEAVGSVMQGFSEDNFTFTGFVNVSASFLGYNKLLIVLYDSQDDIAGNAELPMSVLLAYQNLSDMFILIIGVLLAFLYMVMGATLDLEVIKMIVKKPLGPMVGIVCQYIFMPLIAFGLAKATFPDNPLGQLGLFLGGSCPGGGTSNMWTHLLGGSLDLSIMMTFISAVTAFGAVPLWVLLMGPTIVGDADFVIPYKDIMILVFSLSVPCVIGMFIMKFLPRVGAFLGKLLTPLSLFTVVFLFTFGVYANRYVFELFTVKTILAGFGLPALGYLSGLCLASLLRMPFKDRIAISIETGIQNMTIAVIILKLTLEAPASELTVVFPAAAVVMTPMPLIVVFIIRRVYLWRRRTEEEEVLSKEEKNGKVETGAGEAERGGVKERKSRQKENEEEMVERNGTVAGVEGGIDNPAAEVEDAF